MTLDTIGVNIMTFSGRTHVISMITDAAGRRGDIGVGRTVGMTDLADTIRSRVAQVAGAGRAEIGRAIDGRGVSYIGFRCSRNTGQHDLLVNPLDVPGVLRMTRRTENGGVLVIGTAGPPPAGITPIFVPGATGIGAIGFVVNGSTVSIQHAAGKTQGIVQQLVVDPGDQGHLESLRVGAGHAVRVGVSDPDIVSLVSRQPGEGLLVGAAIIRVGLGRSDGPGGARGELVIDLEGRIRVAVTGVRHRDGDRRNRTLRPRCTASGQAVRAVVDIDADLRGRHRIAAVRIVAVDVDGDTAFHVVGTASAGIPAVLPARVAGAPGHRRGGNVTP